MVHEPGKIWRKRRGKDGPAYGSWHVYAGGRIVNLKTSDKDSALEKARRLLGVAAGTQGHASSDSPESKDTSPPAAIPAFAGKPPPPKYSWAGLANQSAPPANTNAPVGPVAPTLTPAMEGLAEGLADSLAKLNAVVVSVSVRYLANVKPPKVDPTHIDAMRKTWATGLKEMMLIHGIKWWHILAVQNAALATQLYSDGEKLPPKVASPVAPAA